MRWPAAAPQCVQVSATNRQNGVRIRSGGQPDRAAVDAETRSSRPDKGWTEGVPFLRLRRESSPTLDVRGTEFCSSDSAGALATRTEKETKGQEHLSYGQRMRHELVVTNI